MVSPGDLPGTLHCCRQLPGTPGEANESAPVGASQRAAMILHYLVSLERTTLIERFVTSRRGTSEGLFCRQSRSIAFGSEIVGHGEGCQREATLLRTNRDK